MFLLLLIIELSFLLILSYTFPSDSDKLAREEEVANNLGVSGDHMSVYCYVSLELAD